MKLGLVIKITNEGVPGESFSINKEDNWARYTEDVRTPIKELANFDGTERVAYLAKFLGKDGYLICVIKARPEGSGRPNDNTASWIHVPAFVDITSSTICSILKDVEVAISGEKGIDKQQLDSLFSQEYNTKDVLYSAVATIASRNDSTYAVRYYNGDFKLYELLGSAIAQKEYGNYKGIIFIDEQQGITHTSQKVLNFEPKKICQYAPPPQMDGFTPCFPLQDKYQSFNKAIETPEGGQVTIYWVKNGYAVIKKSFVAKEEPVCPNSALISPNEYKIIVRRDHFHIYDPNSIPVKNPDISIDGMPMTGDSMEILESSYNEGVRLLIRVKGLADYRNDKEKLSKNMQIIMGHHFYHYDFEIPLQGEEEKLGYASFSIETRHKLKHCPIQGYETEDLSLCESNRGVNQLIVNDNWKIKVKYFLYGIASVIVAGILYTGCRALENYEFQLGWPPFKEIQKNDNAETDDTNTDGNTQGNMPTKEYGDDNLASAIMYLDNNAAWNKDSLNNFEATRGLFEDLNEFKYQRILDCYNNQLNQSSVKIQEIIAAFEVNNNNTWNPQHGKEANGGCYNSPDDNIIVVQNYIDWLSNEHSASSPQTNGTHGSRIVGRPEAPQSGSTSTGGSAIDKQTKQRGGI